MNGTRRSHITTARLLCVLSAVLWGALAAGPASSAPMYSGWFVDDIEVSGSVLEDFETGTGVWTPSGNWSRVTSGSPHSGVYHMQATFAPSIDDSLTATFLAVAGTNTVSFWHMFDIRPNLDVAYVEVLVGTGWSTLASYTGNQNTYQQVVLSAPSTGEYSLRFRLETAAAAPEPASLALMALGLAGIGYQRRKQIKAA